MARMTRMALGALVLCLSASAPAWAQTTPPPNQPVIETAGEGVIRRPADLAWMQVAVSGRSSNPDDARRLSADGLTAVLANIKRTIPADAITTSSYAAQPEMEWLNGRSQIKGYVAHNQITVRIDDLAKMPALVNQTTTSGATSISSVRFDVKARADLEREALKLAVAEAMDRAKVLASGIGQSLGPIIRVQDDRASPAGMGLGAWNVEGASIADLSSNPRPSTPLMPGDVEIKAKVILTIAIK